MNSADEARGYISDDTVRYTTMATACGCFSGLFRPLLRFSLKACCTRPAKNNRMPQEQERYKHRPWEEEKRDEVSKAKGGFESKVVAVGSLHDSTKMDIEQVNCSFICPDGHEFPGGSEEGGEHLDSDDDGAYQSPSTDPASSSAAPALAILSDVSDLSDEEESDFSPQDGEGGIWGSSEGALEIGESEADNTPSSVGLSDTSFNLSLAGFPELTFLGQGTMCKCFVAKGGALLRCHVVLKMAIEDGPDDSERDLKRELSLMKKLSHPNLASLLGAGSTPKGNTFIVMEYLDGGTLRQRLDTNMGGLGFWTGVRYALQIAAAMKYLHDEAIPDRFVMHRDLKPDNLGFNRDAIKLFDLGMAKLVSRSATEVYDVYFMSGDVESLRYMSPEVASQQPYNEKADVHSFGIVIWELLTGWLPYGGLSPHQFMFQAVQHGTRPLMQYSWDSAFKNVLSSCWAEDPKERPGFARIHEILDILLKNKPEEVTGRLFTPKNTPRGETPMRNRAFPRLLPQRSRSHGDE